MVSGLALGIKEGRKVKRLLIPIWGCQTQAQTAHDILMDEWHGEQGLGRLEKRGLQGPQKPS